MVSAPFRPLLALTTIAVLSTASCAASTAAHDAPSTTPGTTVSPTVATTTAPIATPAARRWIELAEEIVRADKPGPPTSARLYAYTAAVYAQVRAAGTPAVADEATRRVLRALAPAHADRIDAVARELGVVDVLPADATAVVDHYVGRMAADGWAPDDAEAAMATEPTGPGHWVRAGGLGPLNPTAGAWQRWLVDGTAFTVPPPPEPGSDAYREQERIVAVAVRKRDARWQQIIEQWGGAPGTQAPAGIWLDRLWAVAQQGPMGADDLALARAQSALARTVADAFMECWKVKFTYWTARPSMVDPTLELAMANPAFPGYVSGHSTISAAAASVLSMLLPEQHDEWWREAAEARDSRLVAGIHFEIDNTEGFRLGTDVGAAAVARLARGA